MHKRSWMFAGLLLATLAACKPAAPAGDDGAMMQDDNGSAMMDSGSSAMMEGSSAAFVRMDGTMMLYADGEMRMVENGMMMENGMKVMTDGTVMMSDGSEAMMEEGMMMDMSGMMRMMDADTKAMMKQKSMESPGMTEHGGMGQADSSAATAGAVYADYDASVLANGETKVLFFHAAWCPICKKADESLTSWFPSDAFTRSVYKVDYDTSADLKARYGVTYQHTFVVVDGEGNMITKIQGPTDAQLQALIAG